MSVRSSDPALEATLGSTAIAAADAKRAVRPAAYRPSARRRQVSSSPAAMRMPASGSA